MDGLDLTVLSVVFLLFLFSSSASDLRCCLELIALAYCSRIVFSGTVVEERTGCFLGELEGFTFGFTSDGLRGGEIPFMLALPLYGDDFTSSSDGSAMAAKEVVSKGTDVRRRSTV